MRSSGRHWRGLLVGLLAAVVAAGGRAGAAALTLDFWNGITGPDREGMELLIERFNAEHAGAIRVQATPMPWNEFYEKIAVATAAGVPPDVGLLHRDRLPEVALEGILRPIDDVFRTLGLRDSDFVGEISREGIYQGTRYGIPLDVHTLLLYYNQDHLAAAGLSGPPQRPAAFLDAARKLTVDKDGDGNPEQWGTRFGIWGPQWFTALRQMGGNYFGGTDFTQVTLTETPARRALQYVADLMFEHEVAPPPEIWPDMFAGQVSLVVDGIWFLRQAQDLRNQGTIDLRVAKADGVYGDVQRAVWAGSHQFVMFKRPAEDPARIQAAATFVDFMSRNSVTWAMYGQVPIRRAALATDAWNGMRDHHIIVDQAFVFFPPQPWGTGLGIIEDIMNQALRERVSVPAALEDGTARLAERVQEMREQMGI